MEQTETKTTIVEGYLSAGNPVDSLSVTQSYSYGQLEEEIIPLDNLNITIADDNNQFELTTIGNGFYQKKISLLTPVKITNWNLKGMEKLFRRRLMFLNIMRQVFPQPKLN